MWPFDEIKTLKAENEYISRRTAYLESLQLSETDKKELDFLRDAIKDYVIYRYDDGWSSSHKYCADRTLQIAESDLVKSRLYIAVLEAQLGLDGTKAAHEVCERLKAVCGQKAIEQEKEA